MKKIKFWKMSKGVYISLAVCMLLIAAVGIYSAVRSASNLVSESLENVENVSVSNEGIDNLLPKDVFGEGEKQKNDEETLTIPEKNEQEVLNWREPVEGTLKKEFSHGELVFSETMNDYRTHSGIDIAASDGEAVVSVARGTIKDVYLDPLWGMTVEVDHGNGIVSVYKNLSETLPEGIKSGVYVQDGGIIGAVSSSALVEIGELPHLHFEVYKDGVAQDPVEELSIYG